MSIGKLLAVATMAILGVSGIAGAAEQKTQSKEQMPAASSAAPAGGNTAVGGTSQTPTKKHVKKHMNKDGPSKQEDKKG